MKAVNTGVRTSGQHSRVLKTDHESRIEDTMFRSEKRMYKYRCCKTDTLFKPPAHWFQAQTNYCCCSSLDPKNLPTAHSKWPTNSCWWATCTIISGRGYWQMDRLRESVVLLDMQHWFLPLNPDTESVELWGRPRKSTRSNLHYPRTSTDWLSLLWCKTYRLRESSMSTWEGWPLLCISLHLCQVLWVHNKWPPGVTRWHSLSPMTMSATSSDQLLIALWTSCLPLKNLLRLSVLS